MSHKQMRFQVTSVAHGYVSVPMTLKGETRGSNFF